MLYALYIIAGIILLLLIVAALLPGAYNVEKNTIIKREPAFVFSRAADLNYYSSWNPWQQSDPTATSSITGTPATPGHKYAWTGKKVGAGSLTLEKLDDKHVHFLLEFIKPMQSKAADNWIFEPWGDGSETKVTWQNSGALPYPVSRLIGPVISKMLNKQFEQGLVNLKKMCEA